jgi:hypothetical protein
MSFPDVYTARIERILRGLGTSLADPPRLADAVLRLSDHYIAKPDAPTPWDKDWAQIAYACYFFPLNYARVRGVVRHGAKVGFFDGLAALTDFGSGVGTVPLALWDELGAAGGAFLGTGAAVERAAVGQRLYEELKAPAAPRLAWSRTIDAGAARHAGHLGSFSFSLTELADLPAWARASEALMLIEPGTHQDGRRLLALRRDLLADGFFAWAPCTHQAACPLLVESERDWCHDRVAFAPPPWFEALSEHLPMRNPTLACSYVLLRKTPPPAWTAGLARLTGDLRKEKGAARQMVCRGPTREFLSWQKKHGEAPEWPRGALVRLPPEVVVKGKELRLMPGDGEVLPSS